MPAASRPARVYDAAGREVHITQTCTKCHRTKPLASFGLRKMQTGQIRSISQCKACRGAGERRLSDCPECGGKLVSHFEGCKVGALRGRCAACDGSGRGSGTKPCSTCGGTGRAARGERDAAYYAAIEIDRHTHELMDGRDVA